MKLRFNLASLLILFTLACVWAGKTSIDATRQRNAVAWIQANGGEVYYDWEVRGDEEGPNYPAWIRNLCGDDWFQTVTHIEFHRGISDLSRLSALDQTTYLGFSMGKVRDLLPISQFTKLETLDCTENCIQDLSPLQGLSRLESLYIANNQVTDITPLFELDNLAYADCDGNPIYNASLRQKLLEFTVGNDRRLNLEWQHEQRLKSLIQ